jgi:hypothetical protein
VSDSHEPAPTVSVPVESVRKHLVRNVGVAC